MNTKNIIVSFLMLLFLIPNILRAQTGKKKIVAFRTQNEVKTDGILNEPDWQLAPPAGDFVQFEPLNGGKPTEQTVIRVMYDNSAIYIAAEMVDSDTDSILTTLSNRDDNEVVGDIFGIILSPYNDGLNSTEFWVTAAGVQCDNKHSAGTDDYSWNAIWYSQSRITDSVWYVEVKIPYSAIRFSEKPEQEWGINFWRSVKRRGEFSTWNFVDRNINGFPNQSGLLTGISNIKPPLRLSFMPYLSAYYEKNDATGNTEKSARGGLDIKYGINESFTLDMMLIPDFGQVQSDDAVLNLSTVETRYNEKRDFFSEGTEIFNKGGIFYSRRIGGTPVHRNNLYQQVNENEVITENPINTQLINATKFSGRTSKGLGIGILNAMTSPSYAVVSDTALNTSRKIKTQPFTNYDIFVLDQNLRNNSYISFINTNYNRFKDNYMMNVSAFDLKLADKSNTYAVFSKGGISFGKTDPASQTGYFYNTAIEKISGKFRFRLNRIVYNHRYNPWDMGYLENNNQITNDFTLQYVTYKAFRNIIGFDSHITFHNTRLYNPNRYMNFEVNYAHTLTFKNLSSTWLYCGFNPVKYDYFEPRVQGWKYQEPFGEYIGGGFRSDTRKPVAVYFDGWAWKGLAFGKRSFHIDGGPIIRLNDKANINYITSYEINYNAIGFADKNATNDTLYFGRRNLRIISNTIFVNYIFNNKSSLRFKLRHYVSSVHYRQFYILQRDGGMNPNTDYNKNNNQTYNAATIDFSYTWQFLPGSELSVTWKNAIFTSKNFEEANYVENLKTTYQSHQINNLSVRVVYYLDYLTFKKKR